MKHELLSLCSLSILLLQCAANPILVTPKDPHVTIKEPANPSNSEIGPPEPSFINIDAGASSGTQSHNRIKKREAAPDPQTGSVIPPISEAEADAQEAAERQRRQDYWAAVERAEQEAAIQRDAEGAEEERRQETYWAEVEAEKEEKNRLMDAYVAQEAELERQGETIRQENEEYTRMEWNGSSERQLQNQLSIIDREEERYRQMNADLQDLYEQVYG
ncbi:MAG: hypothetical protein M1831_006708 [Alyxoria varia]|nr:MAG: hypothetical protein M1831_006708 [Alyxoria varia]